MRATASSTRVPAPVVLAPVAPDLEGQTTKASSKETAARVAAREMARPQPVTVPAPSSPAEHLSRISETGTGSLIALWRMIRWLEQRDETPQMRTVVINDQNVGSYQTLDQAAWVAKSIGILNPGAAPVYIGINGGPATAQARTPSCPGAGVLLLPVETGDVMLGCDAATLGTSSAVIFLFRFRTVQQLSLTQIVT